MLCRLPIFYTSILFYFAGVLPTIQSAAVVRFMFYIHNHMQAYIFHCGRFITALIFLQSNQQLPDILKWHFRYSSSDAYHLQSSWFQKEFFFWLTD